MALCQADAVLIGEVSFADSAISLTSPLRTASACGKSPSFQDRTCCSMLHIVMSNLESPQRRNALGQPIGEPVPDWQSAVLPPRTAMEGRFCVVEPIDAERHAADLIAAFQQDREGRIWTYMTFGPFANESDLSEWITKSALGDDPLFHAIIDKQTGKATGMAAYLRIAPKNGVIEVGSIAYSLLLQRSAAATETMYLMMRRVFSELGYRRYEWKCDALNEPSRRAAHRLGFQYDGLFPQATIYKGRSRDTAWYSVMDKNWPVLEQAYERWLDPDNFDNNGEQKTPLKSLIDDLTG